MTAYLGVISQGKPVTARVACCYPRIAAGIATPAANFLPTTEHDGGAGADSPLSRAAVGGETTWNR